MNKIKLICSHWFGNSLSKKSWEKCPYKIKILLDNVDITSQIDIANIFDNTKIKIPPGLWKFKSD